MNEQFTVLTYNVGNGRAHPARLADMLRASGADIVALQELSHLQAQVIEDSLARRVQAPGGFSGGICGEGDPEPLPHFAVRTAAPF